MNTGNSCKQSHLRDRLHFFQAKFKLGLISLSHRIVGLFTWLQVAVTLRAFPVVSATSHEPVSADAPLKILVIKLDTLGDVVMVLPLLSALHQRLPHAEITLAVHPSFVSFFQKISAVRVIGIPTDCSKFFRPIALPLRHYQFAKSHLQQEAYDFCLIPRLDTDHEYAVPLAYFSRAKRRISFSEHSEKRKSHLNMGFDRLLTDAILPKDVLHEVQRNLTLLNAMGLQTDSASLQFDFSKGLPRQAVQFAQKHLPEPAPAYVAICPTSGHSSLKQWGVKKIAAVAAELAAQGRTIVLLGSASDAALGDAIEASLPAGCVINLIGKTSLDQILAVLMRCAVFLGNDAGPMHLASLVNTPTVAVFGSSCSHRFGPWAESSQVLAGVPECSPCSNHAAGRCRICLHRDTVCMQMVSVNETVRAVRQFLPLYTPPAASGALGNAGLKA